MLDFYVSDPELMSGVEPQRITRARRVRMSQIGPLFQRIYDNTAVQCTVSPPIASWAKKLFPHLDTDVALETLWENSSLSCVLMERATPQSSGASALRR